MITRTCTKCNETKVLDRFNKRKGAAHGVTNVCKDCNSIYARALRKKLNKKREEEQPAKALTPFESWDIFRLTLIPLVAEMIEQWRASHEIAMQQQVNDA